MKVVLFVFLGILFSTLADVCDDPIRCKLNSLVVSIPDFCLPDQDICIKDFSCGHVDLNSFPSSFQSPTSLELGMNDLTASCAFDYTYNRLIKGSVTASVSDVDFLVDLLVGQDDAKYLPTSTSFSTCNLSSIVVDITFDSSGLENLVPILEKVTKIAIHRILCVKAADFVSTNVTNYILYTLDPNLMEVIESQPSPLPTNAYDSRYYFSWSDSIISKIHSVVNHLRGLSKGGEIVQCLLNSRPSVLSNLLPTNVVKKYFQDESLKSIIFDVTDQELSLSLPNMSVALTSIELSGLDTVEEFSILQPMKESNVSLHTYMSFDCVSLSLGLSVNSKDQQYSELLRLEVELEDFSVLGDVVIAVNEFVLNSFCLDQLSSINCWLNVLAEFSIANLQMHTTVKNIELIQVSGDASTLESDLVALLNNGLKLVFEGFPTLLTDTLNGAVQGPLRNGVNDLIGRKLGQAKVDYPCVTHYPYSDISNFIVWSESNLITFVSTLLDDKIGAVGMNQIMNCMTNYTGTLALDTTRINVEVGGLNSFYELDVLDSPSDKSKPFLLTNKLAMGFCPADGTSCNPLKVLMSTYDLMDETTVLLYVINEIVNKFKVELTISNLELILDLFWKMDKNGMKDLTFSQLSTTGCSASTVSSLYIDNFLMSVSNSELTINEVPYDITKLVAGFMDALSKSDFVSKRNSDMEYKLSVSDQTCKANGVAPDVVTDSTVTDDNDSLGLLQWSLIAIGVLLFCMVSVFVYFRYYNTNRKVEVDNRFFWERYDFSKALVHDPKISKWLRVGFPIAIICTFVLFVYSDLQDIAVAMLEIITPEKTYDIGEVYNFKFGLISQDMWDAKVYALDTLMVALSGVWPNVKLAIMLFTWVVPLELLSSSKRETVMIVVDVLGKWSLIDFFVMILLLCAFYFQLNFGDNIIVNVTMRPAFGFYGFLLATMLSQLLSHVLLGCHRASLKEDGEEAENVTKESLSSLKFEMKVSDIEVNSFNLSQKVEKLKDYILQIRLTKSGIVAVVILILLTAVLLVIGVNKLVMTFEFKGMVGWILKDSAEEHYSYVSMGKALPKHSGIPNTVGIIWFQFAFFMFGIAMPALLLIASLVLWLVPLSVLHQERLLVISEVCNSWSALDVYSVSIIAALFEIQQFAAFMVGDSCDRINELLKYFDDALDGDDKCFDVVATLLPDAWIVFLAAISINFVGMWTLHLSDVCLKQRQRRVTSEETEPLSMSESEAECTDAVKVDNSGEIVKPEEVIDGLEVSEERSSYFSSFFRSGQISLVALLHRIHLITVNHHQKWSGSY